MDSGQDLLKMLKQAFERWKPSVNIPVFETKELSLKETVDLIGQLSNSTSYGDDKIDAFAIKTGAESLYKPIQHVINLSIKARYSQ